MATKIQKLLFVDTNIWLDFYRARNDAGLALLKHAEAISDRIIVTYQVEGEFKKNRQMAILEGMQELKAPPQIPRPGIFSDAKATEVLNRSLKEAEKRVKNLKSRLTKALENPAAHDPVYQACQRIFHKNDNLVLSRENKLRTLIRRKAFRRFLHGNPPRKKNDTSLGDAFNWEWMIHCANENNAELVIVSRDSDYGISFENRAYVNDYLRQEFSERVSKKRELLLYTRLSDALKHFAVPVSKLEEDAETELLADSVKELPQPERSGPTLTDIIRTLGIQGPPPVSEAKNDED
jgi:PIN domain